VEAALVKCALEDSESRKYAKGEKAKEKGEKALDKEG
jgi:hypothetical protein